MNTYQNKAARRYLGITILVSILAMALIGILTWVEWNYLQRMEAGYIAEYPDVLSLLTRYGIQNEVIVVSDAGRIQLIMILVNMAIYLVMETLVILLYVRYLKKRQEQLNILTGYMARIAEGNYALDLADNSEDELSNLKNELYKIALSLSEQARTARSQKIALADSVSDISHQLKTPLTSISVLMDNLLEHPEMETNTRERFLQEISHQTSFMNWMIATLLKLSRLDAGVVEFEQTRVNVGTLLQEVTDNLEIIAELENVTVTIADDSSRRNENLYITGDYNWNREAIQNIVKNAIEHSAPNTSVGIAVESNDVYTAIYVTNYGDAIPREDQRHIFERFYRTSNAATGSVGIGLALAKSIVEQQRGYIRVDSDANQTTFTVKYLK